MCFASEKLAKKKLINSMKFKIIDNSHSNLDLADLAQDLGSFAQKRFGFKRPPTIHFDSDRNNASKPLGKTAFYDPNNLEIHIFVDGRHPKDILRSMAHELVHHVQNEQGSLASNGYAGEGYAQKNPHLRDMEKDAYERGNMCFRDWEDQYKQKNPTIYTERRNKMSLKEWKNKELSQQLMNRWGFKMDLSNMGTQKEYILEEGQDRIFAPSHYCAHHVIHEGKKGYTVDHNWNSELQEVTRYDVKFEDGTIVRNIKTSDLTILEAFNEGDHSAHAAKRDEEPMEEEEEGSTEKYDDDPALKGKQSELPDALQKAIIDKEEDLEEAIYNKVMEMLGNAK